MLDSAPMTAQPATVIHHLAGHRSPSMNTSHRPDPWSRPYANGRADSSALSLKSRVLDCEQADALPEFVDTASYLQEVAASIRAGPTPM